MYLLRIGSYRTYRSRRADQPGHSPSNQKSLLYYFAAHRPHSLLFCGTPARPTRIIQWENTIDPAHKSKEKRGRYQVAPPLVAIFVGAGLPAKRTVASPPHRQQAGPYNTTILPGRMSYSAWYIGQAGPYNTTILPGNNIVSTKKPGMHTRLY
jgi:hypothetical protein